MLENTGIPTEEDLSKVIPDQERLSKGAVAIIECFQKIPCDPCAAACKFGAIKPFKDINDLPQIDFDKCTGCAACVSACPGLAIFVIDQNYFDKEALIKLPYEMLPLPEKGQEVYGLDRSGTKVSKVKVIRVTKYKNKTNVISIAVPKEKSMEIRGIEVEAKNNG